MYILNKQGIIYGSVTDFDLCNENENEKHWKESQTLKKKVLYYAHTHSRRKFETKIFFTYASVLCLSL